MNAELKEKISRPLGSIASGCFIMTARHGDRSTGVLMSWVQQVSFDPPLVTVAVKHGRPIEALVEASGHFVLNTIGGHPWAMFKHFGMGFGPDEMAFKDLTTREIPAGIVIEECIGYLACKVRTRLDPGDHVLYIGEVVDGGTLGNDRPYTYTRTNGFDY
jgi:flavin reductase (DIM6/NTAB) family NADH-FMN oxidoreductase RutF